MAVCCFSAMGELGGHKHIRCGVVRSSCCQTCTYSSLVLAWRISISPIEKALLQLKKETDSCRKNNFVYLIIERLLCSRNPLWKITWDMNNIHLLCPFQVDHSQLLHQSSSPVRQSCSLKLLTSFPAW